MANLMPGLRRSHTSYQDDQNYYEPASEFFCAPSHIRRIIMAVQGELVQAGVVLPYQDLEIARRLFPINGQCPDSRRLRIVAKNQQPSLPAADVPTSTT